MIAKILKQSLKINLEIDTIPKGADMDIPRA